MNKPKMEDNEYEESNKKEVMNEDESPMEGGCDCIEMEDIVDSRNVDNWYSHVTQVDKPEGEK